MLRKLFWWMLLICFAGFAAGFLGALHPAADALSVFRFEFAGASVLLAIALGVGGARRALWLGAVAAVAALPAVWGFAAPSPVPRGDLVLYQKNLLYANQRFDRLYADIRRAAPDFLTVQELAKPANTFAALSDVLPNFWHCGSGGMFTVGVASRWPVLERAARCAQDRGYAAIRVDAPGGPLWVISVHLKWPWPFGQSEQVQSLVGDLAALPGRKLIGGDFNTVPWSWTMRRIRRATGTRLLRPSFYTFDFHGDGISFPIDHILASSGSVGTVTMRPKLGADHRGLVARIDLP